MNVMVTVAAVTQVATLIAVFSTSARRALPIGVLYLFAVGASCNFAFLVALTWSQRAARRAMQDVGDRRACWRCGYDLTDRPAAVCPECGDGG